MRGDLLALLLLLLVVSGQPGPSSDYQAFARLKRVMSHLLSLDPAEEKVEDDDHRQEQEDYQVLQTFEVRQFKGKNKKIYFHTIPNKKVK